MHRFFAQRNGESAAALWPAEARHARTVLRLKEGDRVQLILEDTLWDAVLTEQEDGARLLSPLASPEPRTRVTLCQGLPKGDKMDFVVQKCTEAGVWSIRPVEMERCVVRLSCKDAPKRAERWQRVAQEAAKQSGRAHVPDVSAPVSLEAGLRAFPRDTLLLVPWEEEKALPLRQALQGRDERDIGLFIGPEGGISQEEIDVLKACGAVPVTLGRRIFRTETAGLAALIMALSERGEYD